jgi:hypothetical protein
VPDVAGEAELHATLISASIAIVQSCARIGAGRLACTVIISLRNR